MGKKSKTVEAVSKVIYDPHVDPGMMDVIFMDSGRPRRVPFTFLKFTEEGFIYDETFIPGYKIRTVLNRETHDFLVNRGYSKEKIIGHKWPELPTYPIQLNKFFSTPELYRYASYFLQRAEEKMQDSSTSFDVSAYFGKSTLYTVHGKKYEVIQEVGPFQNTIIHEHGILRGMPSPLRLKTAKSYFPSYTHLRVYHARGLLSIIQIHDECFRIQNGSMRKITKTQHFESRGEVTHVIQKGEEQWEIAFTETKSKHIQPYPPKKDLKPFLGIENLLSGGWREKRTFSLLHDFDFIPIQARVSKMECSTW